MNPYQNIVNMPIEDNKTIADFLIYENYSHWWTIDNGIYEIITSRLLSSCSDNYFKKIFSLLKSTIIFHILYCIINYILFIIITSSTKSCVNYNKTSEYVIVNRSYTNNWKNFGSGIFKDIYNEGIIDNLPKSVKVINLYDPSMFSYLKEYSIYRKIMLEDNIYYPTIYWKYWSWKVVRDEIKSFRFFHNIWEKLSKHDEWFDKWEDVSGVPSKNIKRFIKNQVLGSIPLECGKFSIIENMIKNEKPSVIIMLNEQMPTGRLWVSAARKYGVKTIGLQHGVIINHRGYNYHNPSDVSASGKEIGSSFPVPDVTCVWGEAEYDLLVNKSGYPANQVIVTGNPRYDHLGRASKIYSRDEFCKRYNINPKNKMILWATQCHGWSMDENNAYFKEVFDAVSELSDLTLIIKQHPGEGSIYRELIDKYIQEYNLKIQIIVPDKFSNTTEMVYNCDLIINKNSTTGQEAAAFHKPMIILDFSKEFSSFEPDYGEYVKEGVAVPVYNRGVLRQTIADIFENGCDMKEAQDEYVRNHMYKIDGLAAQRVADVIMQCIKS